MQYDVRVEEVPPHHTLAVVRRRAALADLPRIVPQACGVVWDQLRAQKITGAGRNVAVYLDEAINLEVGVEIAGPFAGGGDLLASTLPGGTVATATHFGPYNQLGHAHHAIRDWCQANRRTMAGPNWEIYGHWLEAWNSDPASIRTDVYYLISPA